MLALMSFVVLSLLAVGVMEGQCPPQLLQRRCLGKKRKADLHQFLFAYTCVLLLAPAALPYLHVTFLTCCRIISKYRQDG